MRRQIREYDPPHYYVLPSLAGLSLRPFGRLLVKLYGTVRDAADGQHIADLRAIRDWPASLEPTTLRQKAEMADRLRRINAILAQAESDDDY
jgi:hypothetical protein